MSNVSIRNLSISFGRIDILESLDLEIAEGEFIVLLGPSGCGKSTLLNAIAGLLDVTSGQIWIKDKNVTWAEPDQRGIGMVFQSYALYPRMSVERNLSFGLRMAKMDKAEIHERVMRAAKTLQIDHLLDRRPADLSGGQRQRVAIGRALVRDVEVFLFDEPLSNLDAKLRAELRVEIKRLHKQLGSTMIFVTHDQVEAMTLADRIAVIHDGVIQQLAPPKEIYHRPINKFVAGFVGAPAMNFFDGTMGGKSGAWTFVMADGYKIDMTGYEFTRKPVKGAPVSLGVRPEKLAFGRKKAGMSSFPAVFNVEEPMGSDSLFWGESDGQPISALIDSDDPSVELDKTVQVNFLPEQASLFDSDGMRI